MLNWLVILPALCLALLVVKAGDGCGVLGFVRTSARLPVAFDRRRRDAMIFALRSALLNRPSRDPGTTPAKA